MSDNKEYWDTLMKKFNSMSDEEFEIYVKECESNPSVKFMIVDDEGVKDDNQTND